MQTILDEAFEMFWKENEEMYVGSLPENSSDELIAGLKRSLKYVFTHGQISMYSLYKHSNKEGKKEISEAIRNLIE